MSSTKEFPFHKARRVTLKEVRDARKAIEKMIGKKRPARKGRPPKAAADKYKPISIRLHPSALAWLKMQARKRSLPYQTIINEILLKEAA